jgi:hypothetical protein
MSNQIPYPESDPRYHSLRIRKMLGETMKHMREDVAKVSDPKAQALFEVSAEVLNGLINAYDHFEHRSEDAWR